MRDSVAAPPLPALWRSLSRSTAWFWSGLTQLPAYSPAERRRRGLLLDALIWGLLALFGLVLVGMYGLRLGRGPLLASGGEVLVALTPVLLLAYWLNHHGRHTTAVLLLVLVISAASWVLARAIGPDLSLHPDLLFYPIVAVILAALLLPGPLTLLTGLVNLIALLALRLPLPPGFDPISLVVWYLFVTCLMGIASALYRRDLERLAAQAQALAADVQARRLAEAALQESEQRFHNAFEFASVGVALVGLDGQWLQVNPAMSRITGYPREALLATTAQSITHPDDWAADQYHKDQLYAGHVTSYELEKRYLHPAGHVVWVRVNASVVRDPAGRPLHFVAQIQDITERRQVQAALAESEQRLASAFHQAGIGMAWSALDGRYLIVNDAMCALLGYPAAELTQMSWRDVTFPDELPESVALYEQAVSGQLDAYQIEKRYRHKDGRPVWVLLTVKLLRAAQGAPLYFFAQAQDITARHAAVEALRESGERYRAMLEEAERLRQFNASIAENMTEGLVLEDPAGCITLTNPRLQTMLGYAPAELIGRPSLDLIASSERAAVAQHAAQRPVGLTSRYETRLRARDGREIPALVAGTPLTKDGVFTGTLAILIDISERKATEEALQTANAKLRGWLAAAEQRTRESALLSELSDLLQSCRTLDEAYQVIPPILAPLFPGDAGQLYVIPSPGQPAERMAHWGPAWAPDPEALPQRQFGPADCWALRRGRVHTVDLTSAPTAPAPALICAHVSPPWPAAYLCVSLTAQGETLGVLHLRHLPPAGESAVPSAEWLAGREQLARTLADSLALALANLRLREHLHDQSIRDPLTGLYNRRYLQETLGRELHRAARERQPVGLVVFDIDHFKSFNDSLGHEAGDHVLREFGHLLLAYTRGQDVACRLGGEEFVLLLPGAPLAVTLARAELIRQAVAAHETLYRGLPIPRLTVSAGVAAYPEHEVSGVPLLRAADQALYAAKAAGRNCVRVAGPDSVSGLTALQE